MVTLSDYRLTYEITSLPTIVFAGMTAADEPFHFTRFEVPPINGPIECRFSLFDKSGNLIELSNQYVHSTTLVATCNIVPLRMIEKLVKPDL